ncbi:MAG: hypothetical protein ABIM42_06720 [candidate division WOR-3 bacterium]
MKREKRKLVFPNLNLKKFYSIYLSLDVSENAKRRSSEEQAVALLKDLPKELSYEDFKLELKKKLIKKFNIEKVLKLLTERNLPFNFATLQWFLDEIGIKISQTSAKALVKILSEIDVISLRKIAVRIRKDHDKLYEYVVNNGIVKYNKIEKKFVNARKLVMDLVKQGKLKISYKNAELKKTKIVDLDDLKEKIPEHFISIWYDENGKAHRKLLIPGDANVCAEYE